MQKIIFLFLICLTMLVKSQTTTYTLNAISDFSDFTIGGTPNNGTTTIQSSNFAPLSFTLGNNCNKTFVSPTYTAPIILDSVVVTFSTVATVSISAIKLDKLPNLSFPTYYPTNSLVRFTYYNTNSVTIQTLTINSTHPIPNGYVSIFNFNVVGYKTSSCPTPITYSIQVTPPTCSVCCDGSAQVVNLTGGCSAPYSGQWNDGSWGLIKNNLCSGSYTVTVMDSQGGSCCPSVPQGCFVPSSPCITFSIQITPESCNGCCDGSAEVVNLSGGCAPFSYQWSSIPSQNSYIATNLCSGSYSVTVSDIGCCPSVVQGCFVPLGSTTSINVNNLDNSLSIFPNPTNSILNIIDKQNQFQNATIVIKNYLGQVVFVSAFNNQIDLSQLSSGMYYIVIKDKLSGISNKIIIK